MSAPMEANGHASSVAPVAAAEPTKPSEVGSEPIADAAAPVNGEAHVMNGTAAAARDVDAPDAALIAAFSEGRRTRGSVRKERTPSPAEVPEPEAKAEAPEAQARSDGEAPPAIECPEIPRMLEPSHASQLSLVGRNIDVLWPDDGSWWKARVVNLNPHNGMATLYYEPNAKVTEEDDETRKETKKENGETSGDAETREPEAQPETADETVVPAETVSAAPMDAAPADGSAANGDVTEDAKKEETGDAAADDDEGEGEVEELNLREACVNREVRWSASEIEKMKEEYLKVMAGGPIAPADKSAVPCPFCDRRAFKYLRSLEKHCWNEHGARLTREQLDDFEKQLRVGKKIGGPTPLRRKREYIIPELITINYDEMYDILEGDDAIKARGQARVAATSAALEATKRKGGPAGQRATLWAAAETDLCHVCGEADPNFWHIEGDCIVMCDGCDSQTHLSCYGLTEVPDGDKPWFCQGCVDGVKQGEGRPADAGMCALCPVPGGVLTRVQPPSRWSTDWGSDGTHAHLCCAGNLPEVIVTPSTTCAPIADMHRVKNSRMALDCGLCGLSGGCVQCSMKNCFQGFHVLCGRAANLEHIYPDREDNLSPAVFFCAEHSAPAFAQRRLKAAGLVAATGSAAAIAGGPNAAPSALANGQPLANGVGGPLVGAAGANEAPGDNDTRLAANAEMKAQGLDVERRKAQFVIRLWHRFVPFLPQPLDPARRADLLKRSGRFATRVMTKARIDEAEMKRLSSLSDAQGEAEVKADHENATERAMREAKDGKLLNEGLREYQREGVAWLAAQHAAGAGGGILGDDMGLGKTLQVLSFLQYLRDAKGESGPHLVVCPLSVLPTWVTEAKRWCPSLRAVAFHGPEAERNRLKAEVLLQGTFDVLVTTYEMLTAEQSMLAARFHFRYLVLDEAQRVKNDTSLVSQAVRRVRTTAALLLTGTPLQNNLHELRALVSVLFQDVLEAAGAEKMDADSNAAFGDDTAVAAARSLLQPLMLERTKANVLQKILPPKTETVVRIPLSDEQRKLYKTLLEGEQGLFGKLAASNATSEKEALDNGRCIAEQSELASSAGAGDENVRRRRREPAVHQALQLAHAAAQGVLPPVSVRGRHRARSHRRARRRPRGRARGCLGQAHRAGRDAPASARGRAQGFDFFAVHVDARHAGGVLRRARVRAPAFGRLDFPGAAAVRDGAVQQARREALRVPVQHARGRFGDQPAERGHRDPRRPGLESDVRPAGAGPRAPAGPEAACDGDPHVPRVLGGGGHPSRRGTKGESGRRRAGRLGGWRGRRRAGRGERRRRRRPRGCRQAVVHGAARDHPRRRRRRGRGGDPGDREEDARRARL
jgi:SWI/SNF-related matrix-associated actin-dependent regulator of chromatin subfamily A member 5